MVRQYKKKIRKENAYGYRMRVRLDEDLLEIILQRAYQLKISPTHLVNLLLHYIVEQGDITKIQMKIVHTGDRDDATGNSL